jgi:superfamily II DNA/RNA helicase
VEAGFDFDAGLMLTELAPLDSLVQRAGRVARRKGAKGRVLVFDVDGPEPYADGLVKETRRLLLETAGDALRKSLYDVETARGYLDEVYTEPLVNQLKEKVARDLLEAEEYLRSLRLFSSPPEEDFRLRRGFYVTVIVPEVYEKLLQQSNLPQEVFGKLSKLLKYFKSPPKEPVKEDFEPKELQHLLPLLEKSSLSLGFEELPQSAEERQPKKGRKQKRKESKEEILVAARLYIRKVDERARTYRVELRAYEKERGVRPLGIYLLRTGLYSGEEGLVARGAA